jgi:hypothetical protein
MNEGFVADRPAFEWLTEKSGGWQFGEQGILVALANLINKPGQCVEVGAGDGEGLPLTIEPFYNYGLDCVLYEKDSESLKKLHEKFPKANLRASFSINTSCHLSDNLMLCVIDVDGIDSVIMEQVLRHHPPKILMVEHFDSFHSANTNQVQRVPAWLLGCKIDGGFTIQDNAQTLEVIAKQHDYSLLGKTRVNSIFVHNSVVAKVMQDVPS